MKVDVVFPSKIHYVDYIANHLHGYSPIKVQSVLYFTWAIYSATYGCMDIDQSELKGSGITYPKELFKANFKAWRYGAIDVESWQYYVHNSEDIKKTNFSKITTLKLPYVVNDIKLFIDDIIINDVDKVNDFGLVMRMHEDTAWKQVYYSNCDSTNVGKMNNEEIKADYIKYVS